LGINQYVCIYIIYIYIYIYKVSADNALIDWATPFKQQSFIIIIIEHKSLNASINVLQEAYLVVDTTYEILPEMIKDLYWNQTNFNVPYTAATQHTNKQIFLGSAVDMEYVFLCGLLHVNYFN